MMPRVEIVNIVATIKLDPMPDPNEILEKIPGSKPVKRFRGALVRLGRIPVLFYKNRIVITGVRGKEEVDRIVDKLMDLLREYGFKHKLVGVEIVNVTARVDLGRRINLVEAAERLGGIYDPDYRPYMVARINDTVIMLSHNGKLVILGAQSNNVVVDVVKLVASKLKKPCSNQRL